MAQYQKAIPAEILARSERAKAAHFNGYESAPFFIGAVLAASMARVDYGMFFSY